MKAFWGAATAAVEAWGPDVIHAHDLNTLPAGRRAADALNVPLIYDSHELWRHRNRHGQWRPVGRLVDAWMERRLAPSANAVITVSPSIGKWLERRYRLRRPVHIVRNTPLRQVREPMTGILGRRPGEKVVVYSGRFTSGRGLEDMVKALASLPDNVVLSAVGYGDEDYVESLLRLADRSGVRDRVRLVGPVAPADVPAAIADGDVALIAIAPTCLSYRYALPNKLFEAVQAGLPVVASDLPDLGEVVAEYGLGRRFRPGDPRELAAAVREVLADPGAARSSSRRAADDLCWENEVERLLSCYAELGFALVPREDRSAVIALPPARSEIAAAPALASRAASR